MLSVPEFIGGNVLIHPPIQTLDKGRRPGGSTIEPGDLKIEAWRLQNRGLEAPKSRPGRSKIEPRALQDTIFERRLT